MQPGGTRDRLTRGMFVSQDEQDPIGVLNPALHAVLETEPVEQRLRKLTREGQLSSLTNAERLAEAMGGGQISQVEFDAVTRARKLKRDVIMVDDFDKTMRHHDEALLERYVF
jgi:acyl-CoA dehydrogenase